MDEVARAEVEVSCSSITDWGIVFLESQSPGD